MVARQLHDAFVVAERVAAFDAALKAEREAGERLAGELRACAQQEAQVATLSQRYGPLHPNLIQAKSQLEELRADREIASPTHWLPSRYWWKLPSRRGGTPRPCRRPIVRLSRRGSTTIPRFSSRW